MGFSVSRTCKATLSWKRRDMSTKPKNQLLERLRNYYDLTPIAGQSFYMLNSKAIVYFRYSKQHRNNTYFFGVEADDLSRFQEQNTFIIFICGDAERTLILASTDFLNMVQGTKPISNQWKILITEREGRFYLRVAGKGQFDVSSGLNCFDFTPSTFRVSSPLAVYDFRPLRREVKRERKQEAVFVPTDLSALIERLCREPEQHTRFEEELTHVFSELGLEADHIGGPGDTDILIKEPFRAIVDGKTTSEAKLSQVNFSRLKRHMHDNYAAYMMVVSVDFSPAVIQDAQAEGASLVPIEVLAAVLRQHQTVPLPLKVIESLFVVKGKVDGSQLHQILVEANNLSLLARQARATLECMDYVPRSVDEIKGRIDIHFDHVGIPRIDTALLEAILMFLSSPILGLVLQTEGKFAATMRPDLAIRRLRGWPLLLGN
jgi:hypothetical protein